MGNEQNRFGSQIQKVRRNKGTKNKPNVKYDFWIRLHEKRINNLQHKLRRKSNRAESTTVSSPRFLLHTIFHLSPAFSLSPALSLSPTSITLDEYVLCCAQSLWCDVWARITGVMNDLPFAIIRTCARLNYSLSRITYR